MKMTVIYEEYERYGGGQIVTKVLEGKNEREILFKVATDILGLDEEQDVTPDFDVKKWIEEQSGDGNHYIIAMFEGEPKQFKLYEGNEDA